MENTNRNTNVISIGDSSFRTEAILKDNALKTPSTVLIAGPLASKRHKLRQILRDSNFEFLEASTGTEAAAAVSLHQVDLALVDVNLPEPSGIEFCRTIKKAAATRFTPVFMVAADDDLDIEVRAIEAGADALFADPLAPRLLQARVQASLRNKAMIDSLDDAETVLFSLAQSVEERDPSLGRHCDRLALMASAMGVALGLDARDIVALKRAGYLHDIGKLTIPDEILFKQGPLTQAEWEIMKGHVESGVRICSGIRSLQAVLPIIRHHHERWNGSGYPDGKKGEEIPLLARILQIADIYDALTTERPYKKALSPEEAMAVLREEVARGWRDPKLTEQFAALLPTFGAEHASDVAQLSLHALARSVGGGRVPSDPGIRPIAENRKAALVLPVGTPENVTVGL
jgi:putative two-component system response regulator